MIARTTGEPAAGVAGARTVRDLIDLQASLRPQAPYALAVDGGLTLTFGELARQCRAFSERLQALGSRPGDHVSVVMPNGLGTLAALLGTLYGGRCVNPVNLLSQPEQMRYVLTHADAGVLVVAPQWEEQVRAMIASLGREVCILVIDPDKPSSPLARKEDATAPAPDSTWSADPAVSPDALGLLMYTSGTTGKPKGVMLTQANLAASAAAISAEHRLTENDRVLAVLPLFHINAFAVTMLSPLAHGGSLVMAPRFSVNAFWRQALDTGCTWINVVPTIIAFLLVSEAPPREALVGIRFCRSASAPLAPEQHRAFEQKFGIGIIETMGLTETVAPVFSNPLLAADRKIGSVGRPSGCEARVADPTDSSGTAMADGTPGEILLRGAQVMRGYYKDEGATLAAFRPGGWLRSGDLGYRDVDGFFHVTGRLKELIIKGGENIAPREIDEALLRHPAVLEAAAVGIPDPHYGQEIMVCVILRDGATCSESDLRAFCDTALGRYKTPRIIRFVAELPRGPSGKVQRLKLLDHLLAS